ncbi:MAG: HEAT repeat domain-containing protein [Pseudomonadota bacterium]
MRALAAMVLISVSAVLGASGSGSVALTAIEEPPIDAGDATAPRLDGFHRARLAGLAPQTRAEEALQLAVNRVDGAARYVIGHAQQWRGQFASSERLTALITVGINSPRIEVRMATFEIHLAQYELARSPEAVDALLERYLEDPEGAGPWALWSIGVIGARGVDRARVFDELRLAASHPSERVRRWAVDGLGKLGGVVVIEPLLEIAAVDPSPIVRERAFCALAHGATLHVAQRYAALPGLLIIAEDAQALDDTRTWAFQALREISGLEALPDDAWIWRERLLAFDLIEAP